MKPQITERPLLSKWSAECFGGPLDGRRRKVEIGWDGPVRLTFEPRRGNGGLYVLTLDWKTGKAAWEWTP